MDAAVIQCTAPLMVPLLPITERSSYLGKLQAIPFEVIHLIIDSQTLSHLRLLNRHFKSLLVASPTYRRFHEHASQVTPPPSDRRGLALQFGADSRYALRKPVPTLATLDLSSIYQNVPGVALHNCLRRRAELLLMTKSDAIAAYGLNKRLGRYPQSQTSPPFLECIPPTRRDGVGHFCY